MFPEHVSRPHMKSSASSLKLAFSEGGLSNFKSKFQKVLMERLWEKQIANPLPKPVSCFLLW